MILFQLNGLSFFSCFIRMKNILILLLGFFFLQGCGDNRNLERVCTEQLEVVSVNVFDELGDHVLLDRTQTEDVNGSILSSNSGNFGGLDFYTVLTDSEMAQVDKEGTNLIFKGWIDNEEVFIESFTIGKDCCHIFKISGPDEIQINQ